MPQPAATSSSSQKNKGGRPSLYNKSLCDAVRALARRQDQSLTDEQIAAHLGVGVSTIYDWKKIYPEFSEAIKESKSKADSLVESALYKRAFGFEYDEVKKVSDEGGLIKTEITKKQVAPDTTAQIFWLKNRRPDLWRDAQRIEHSGEVKIIDAKERLSRRLAALAAAATPAEGSGPAQ